MKWLDLHFTNAGRDIVHSESDEQEHPLCQPVQFYMLPWEKGLLPAYQLGTFHEEEERKGFVKIISPLKHVKEASIELEVRAEPDVEGKMSP